MLIILNTFITGQSLSERLRLPPPTYKHININIPKLKIEIEKHQITDNHAGNIFMIKIK